MKNLVEYLNYSKTSIEEGKNDVVNLYILNCGAMNGFRKELANTINELRNSAIVNINTFDDEGIHAVDEINIEKVKFEGPHLDKFDDVVKETKDHLDELSFIITC